MILKFGDYNFGAANLTLKNDTLRFYTPAQAGTSTYYLGQGGNNWDCHGNSVVDMVYEGGITDTNIIMSNGGTLELMLKKTVFVQVVGRNGLPVSGATVTATNNYNRAVLTGTTDSEGIVRAW